MLRNQINSYMTDNPTAKLYVTGHSLGELTAVLLVKHAVSFVHARGQLTGPVYVHPLHAIVLLLVHRQHERTAFMPEVCLRPCCLCRWCAGCGVHGGSAT